MAMAASLFSSSSSSMARLFIPFLLFLFHARAQVRPMACPNPSLFPTCGSSLYVVPRGLPLPAVAARYAANASLIQTIPRREGAPADLLVEVPCACEAVVGAGGNLTASAFFHDAAYTVRPNDTADAVTSEVFSGLAWGVPENLVAGENITVQLACGCSAAAEAPAGVASYVVEAGDTLNAIAGLLDSDVEAIERMNPAVNASYLVPGQLLFVPMGARG